MRIFQGRNHILSLLFFIFFIPPALQGAAPQQMIGAEIVSEHSTGYGLYIVQMKPSDEPGVISSFFLFSTSKLWPKSWAEIDIEFTPGYETSGERTNRFVLNGDKGSCFDPTGNYSTAFFQKDCPLVSVAETEITIKDNLNRWGQKINRALSMNTFGNTPLVMDQRRTNLPDPIVQTPSDFQVFYLPPAGLDPFKDFYNYYIWYTPRGVFWSAAIDPKAFPFPQPDEALSQAKLPQPVFAKLWNSNQGGEEGQSKPEPRFQTPGDINFRSPAQKYGMAYHSDQFTPLDNSTDEILAFGRSLKIIMNIWDGSYTGIHSKKQAWGGRDRPTRQAAAIYKKVAYFPITGPAKAGDRYPQPQLYPYGKVKLYSDFTSPTGAFYLDGRKASFNQLWMVEDGDAAPLGIRSGYNVLCYPKYFPGGFPLDQNGLYLHLRQPGNYAIPTDGANIANDNTHTNCRWADQRGT